MKDLVVVESYAKSKTIQSYLGSSYRVVASGGHLFDLTKKEGVMGLRDTDKTFEPIMDVIPEKRDTLSKLIALAKESRTVWLAADNDREGEAIAAHLEKALRKHAPAAQIKRIVFNEITRSAIRQAIESARQVDRRMVESQQTRRVLDRLLGFTMTKLVSNRFESRGVRSAGRVQTVVLSIISQRESEVDAHKPTPYWTLRADFAQTRGLKVEDAVLTQKDGLVWKVRRMEDAKALMKPVWDGYYIDEAKTRMGKASESAPPPLTTSALQQRAASIGMSVRSVMKIAQELYEEGLITYMRTDSRALSADALEGIRAFVGRVYGPGELRGAASGRKATKSSKHAQEAHEAIRPTRFEEGEAPAKLAGADRLKVYALVFRHTIASQMRPAEYAELTVALKHRDLPPGARYTSRARELLVPGWKAVYGEKGSPAGLAKLERAHKEGLVKPYLCAEIRAKAVWTSPPSRFSEPSMVRHMEQSGIGRPSTYVSTLQVLYERDYVQKRDVSGETKRYAHMVCAPKRGDVRVEEVDKPYYEERGVMVPTDAGRKVSAFLMSAFPEIVNVDFTSRMEDTLDRVAAGNDPGATYLRVMRDFYPGFAERASAIRGKKGPKVALDASSRTMRNGMVVRVGQYGPLIENKTPAPGQPQFYSLKPYLKLTNASLEDVTDKDVAFVTSFPRKVGPFTIRLGRYGFYASKEGSDRTLTVYPKFLQDMRDGNFDFLTLLFEKYGDVSRSERISSKKTRPRASKGRSSAAARSSSR